MATAPASTLRPAAHREQLARELVLAGGELLLRISKQYGIHRRRLRAWRDGIEPRKPGRPPIDDTKAAAVREHLQHGHSYRSAAELAGIGKSTAHDLVTGRRRQAKKPQGKLQRGEIQLAEARRLECGHTVTITPCRTCAAQATADKFRQLQSRAATTGGKEPRAPRLSSELRADQAARLQAIRNGRCI